MNLEIDDYFIMRNGHAHGPCSLDELRNYLAYGSMMPGDLVSAAGQANWRSVTEVLAAAQARDDDDLGSRDTDPWHQRMAFVLRRTWRRLKGEARDESSSLEIRRRVVRFRDWEQVPPSARGSRVLWLLITGFLFSPPRLWAACAQVFSTRVFRRSADEAGYLKTWPRGMETVGALLIVTQTALWCSLLLLAADKAAPTLRLVSTVVNESYRDWMKG